MGWSSLNSLPSKITKQILLEDMSTSIEEQETRNTNLPRSGTPDEAGSPDGQTAVNGIYLDFCIAFRCLP